MVQFYIFSLIIDSVSCPDIWKTGTKNRPTPFITTKTVTSNASSPPHVDVPPAAPGRGRRWGRGSGCDAATRGWGWGWRGACLGIASSRRRRRCPRVAKGGGL